MEGREREARSLPEGLGTWRITVVRVEAEQKGLAGKPGRERQPEGCEHTVGRSE